MPEFTVGEVAGAVNVGFLFLQITMPMLQVLVLVGFLHRQNTAITWSVVSRFIQSTFWPTLLSCDSAAGRRLGVQTLVAVMTYIALLTTTLLAIAGALTPVGLGQSIVEGGYVNATFEYATDPSIFGNETPERQSYTNSRSCGAGSLPCPGVSPADKIPQPGQFQPFLYEMYIPNNTTECFRSGTATVGDLVSDPFEIQFRQFWNPLNRTDDPKKVNTTGDYSMLESVLLFDTYSVREGIIIDPFKGSIGFRNHTVPTKPSLRHGAAWTEDLLWIDPITTCIDTNWSLQTRSQLSPFATGPQSGETEVLLINHGFDSNLPIPSIDESNPQTNPDLETRASLAAYMFGVHLSSALYLKPSNESIGSTYSLDPTTSVGTTFFTFGSDTVGLALGDLNEPYADEGSSVPEIISLPNSEFNLQEFNTTKFFEYISSSIPRGTTNTSISIPPNTSFSAAYSCRGYDAGDSPSMNRLLVECGYAIPPPIPIDNDTATTNTGGYLKQSIQVCASSLRATIRETSFKYNGSSNNPSLTGLTVTQVKSKNFPDQEAMPVWGVENPGDEWNVSNIQLLWGIVDRVKFNSSRSLWTIQSDGLYLPAFEAIGDSGNGYGDSMGASRGLGQALKMVYSSTASVGSWTYDGTSDRRMMLLWRKLSSSSATMAKIPNLIWMDIVANMLVGTKSLNDAFPSNPEYKVQVYILKITYNYLYAIPGLLCWAFWVWWVIASAGLALFSKTPKRVFLNELKALINRLSVGRPLVAMEKPGGDGDLCAPTTQWVKDHGRTEIDIFGSMAGEGLALVHKVDSADGQAAPDAQKCTAGSSLLDLDQGLQETVSPPMKTNDSFQGARNLTPINGSNNPTTPQNDADRSSMTAEPPIEIPRRN